MPRFTQDELESTIQPGQMLPDNNTVVKEGLTEEKIKESPGVVETFKSGIIKENPIVSTITNEIKANYDIDPDFNPVQEAEKRGLVDMDPSIYFSVSKQEFDDIVKQYDNEKELDDILSRSGWVGFPARMVGAITSPTTAIPAIGSLKTIYKSGRIAKGMATGAAYTAGAIGIDEAVLQSTQLTRPEQESWNAIFGGAFLGAIMGGAIGAASKPLKGAVQSSLIDIANEKTPSYILKQGAVEVDPKSMGAAEIDYIHEAWKWNPKNLPDTLHFMGKEVPGPLKIMSVFRSPVIRGLSFKSPLMKEFTSRLYQHDFYLNMVKEGHVQPTATESLLNLDLQKVQAANRNMTNLYAEYVGTAGKVLGVERAALKGTLNKNLLSPFQFSEEVGKAIRRGGEHEIPQVAAAAQKATKMIDDATEELLRVGRLTKEDLDKGALTSIKHYLTRVYNKEFIRRDIAGSQKIVSKAFQKQSGIEDLNSKISKAKPGSDEYKELLSQKAELVEKADEDAVKHIDKILRASDQGAIQDDLIGNFIQDKKPGFLKDRMSQLSDEDIEPLLINDGITISTQFATQAHSLARISDMLDDMGVKSIKELEQLVELEFQSVGKALNISQSELLNSKKFVRDTLETTLGFRNSRGEYDEIFQSLKKFQVLTLLGAVTLSSAPDLAMTTFKHGPLRSIRDGFIPMATKIRENKALREEWGDLLVGVNSEMAEYLSKFADPSEVGTLSKGKVSKALDILVGGFSKSLGFNKWNSKMRTMGIRTTVSRTLRGIDSNNIKEINRLKMLGLDDDTLKIIKQQYKKYGELGPDGHGVIGRFDKWDPTPRVNAAKEKFQAAVSKDIDSTNILPGRGDMPLMVQSNVPASVLYQLKGFIAAATNKIALSGINRAEKEVVEGMIGSIVLGALTYVIKTELAGKEADLSPDNLITEGIARSGVGGFLTEIPLAIFSGSSRHTKMNLAGFTVGPTFSGAWDLAQLARSGYDIAKGDKKKLSETDKYTIRRMIPLQNHLILQIIFRLTGVNKKDDSK